MFFWTLVSMSFVVLMHVRQAQVAEIAPSLQIGRCACLEHPFAYLPLRFPGQQSILAFSSYLVFFLPPPAITVIRCFAPTAYLQRCSLRYSTSLLSPYTGTSLPEATIA